MSLLTANSSDIGGGAKGKPLPNRVWKATVLEAATEARGTGKQIKVVLGNFRDEAGNLEIALPDGSTYKPGNRKVFDRQWYEQQSAKALEIGERNIKQLAMSAGILPKPTSTKSVTLVVGPEDKAKAEAQGLEIVYFDSWEDFAAALVAAEGGVTVKTKQERAQTKNPAGVYVDAFVTEDGETTFQSTTNGKTNEPRFDAVVAFYIVK